LAEWEESKAINRRAPGSIPEATLRRQKVQWEKSTLDALVNQMEFTIAGHDEKVAEAEVELVENELARRTLRAPFDGVVVQLFKRQSEWVYLQDNIILRLVRMDSLRVEGFLNADEYAPDEVDGAKVTITVSLAGGQKATFQSTISHVSPLVEASGDYRIWAEVDNPPGRGGYPWLLRPGLEAEMLIQLKRSPAVATR
jgi:multidrug resistance efflux pump